MRRIVCYGTLLTLFARLAACEPAGLKTPAGPGAGFDIAGRAQAHATSGLPGHPAAGAVDTLPDTAWRTDAAGAVFWVDLGARMRLAGISFRTHADGPRAAALEVIAWQDGWKTRKRVSGSGERIDVPLIASTQYVGLRSATSRQRGELSLNDFLVFQAGWRPQREGKDLRLQDFCFFRHKGYTYVASMMKDFAGEGITVARSRDLAVWQPLGVAVGKRTPEDRAMLWAPHVVEHAGRFHMFYTGVTQSQPGHWNQKILVASTTDPSATQAWQRDENVKFVVDGRTESWFRPSHPGHVWPADAWADCRDPMVFHDAKDRTWYMFNSGTDTTGGIVGVATAPDVLGPWEDRGPVLRVARGVPESAYVLPDPGGGYVMVVNHSTPDRKDGGIKIARARGLRPEPGGGTSFAKIELLEKSADPGLGGWAHEFALAEDGSVLSAYLTGYWVNFQDVRFVETQQGWTLAGIPDSPGPQSQPATD